MTLDDIIREAIEDAVARNGGDKIAAAKELAIGKTTVYRLMKMWATKKAKKKPRKQAKRRSLKRKA